ncbi:acetyl-CoA synthetase-like protein [Schizophyllum commune H4-8]|uniref:acetyl-CoA synthetase-like protein n=1 Tax=Schizophyllum commune (strain H4-8 / FGSC 9210) TaxID=578458 RepID=UPI0021603B44|nr:acetyl-CoA synthetase-like protein [Schizophyllum commune H4-8]KAI5891092.1 acetyl-CoA synthetase-like protein [Schizophyllum commune H4-8]
MSASAGDDLAGPALAFPPDFESDGRQPSTGTLSSSLPPKALTTTAAEELEALAVAALRILHYRCTSLENVDLTVIDAQGVRRARLNTTEDTTVQGALADARSSLATATRCDLEGQEVKLALSASIPLGPQQAIDMYWLVSQDSFEITYNTIVFHPETIHVLAQCYREAFEAVLRPSDVLVSHIPFEVAPVLLNRANVATTPPITPSYEGRVLRDAFRDAVTKYPNELALDDGTTSFTYSEVDLLTNAVAQKISEALASSTLHAGYIATCIPPSPLAILVILSIIKYGSAYVPLDIRLPESRLQWLVEDSGSSLLITVSDSPAFTPGVPRLDLTDFLSNAKSILTSPNPTMPAIRPTANDVAYIMYTSGSTGLPKGVRIRAPAVLSFAYDGEPQRVGPRTRVAQVNNLAWDGTVFDVWCTLLRGATLVSFSRYDVLDPAFLARLFHERNITATFLPTSQLRQILAHAPALFEGLESISFGGELLGWEHVRQLRKLNEGMRMYHVYGPTECCCYVVGYEIPPLEEIPARGVVPIGRALPPAQVLVLDPNQRLVPPGVQGELYIGGRQVGEGYLNRPAETAAAFVDLDVSGAGEGPSRFYRTGDLVKWLPTGVIQFERRLNAGQVKIRGQRLELAEVEAAIVRTGLVADAAVACVKEGDPYLVAFVVRDQASNKTTVSEKDVFVALKASVPAHMIPRFIYFLDTLPLNNSGKLDRRKIEALALEAHARGYEHHHAVEVDYDAPRTELERRICEAFQDILCLRAVGATSDFFDIGGHSLLAQRLKWRLTEQEQVELGLPDIFAGPTPRQLAARIESLLKDVSSSQAVSIADTVRALPERRRDLLSLGQLRIFNLDRLDGPEKSVCNSAHWLVLEGDLDVEVMARVVEDIGHRHEALRHIFVPTDDEPRLKIVDTVPSMEVIDVEPGLQGDALDDLLRYHATRHFEITTETSYRPILFRLTPRKHILLLSMHHIDTDGFSRDVHYKEVRELYSAYVDRREPNLPGLPIQYSDWAQFQRTPEYERFIAPQMEYWVNKLDGFVPLEIPLDFPRPSVVDHVGGLEVVDCQADLVHALDALCHAERATMFMVLVAALRCAAFARDGAADAAFPTTAACRNRAEVADLAGYFVNLLVYRIPMRAGVKFRDVLRMVRDDSLEGMAQQDAPYPRVMAELAARGTPVGTRPLRTIIGYHVLDAGYFEAGGIQASPIEVNMHAMRWDIEIFFNRREGAHRMWGEVNYRKDLYRKETMRAFAKSIQEILARAARDPDFEVVAGGQPMGGV